MLEQTKIGLATALPYMILAALSFLVHPALCFGICVMVVLVSVIWPIAMGEFIWRYWKRGKCLTPGQHVAEFVDVDKDKIATFYYPGLGGSWMQALRYTGKEGLSAAIRFTGHPYGARPKAYIPNAPFLLYNICPVNPPEVMTGFLDASLYFYTRLATSAGRMMQDIKMGEEYALAWPLINFAQHYDIDRFLSTIRAVIDRPEMSQRRFVLAGSSRGASTVLGAVTKMTPEERARIAFVLLEGAFDSVENVSRARYGGGLIGAILPSVLSCLTRYDPAFPSPLELAKKFPDNVPILFVTSETDWHVPMANTLAVRDAVLAARAGDTTHVHTLVLKKSHHSYYVNDNLEDQTSYRAAMENMYRLYTPQRGVAD